MTNYVQIEREFIERTLHILDQYKELSLHLPVDKQYEVTLLMNCLLGLLVYPQQIAHQRNYQDWLTEKLVINVGHDWGIEPEYTHATGYKLVDEVKIITPLEKFTARKLIREMRNQAAHAGFKVNDNDPNRQIESVEFGSDKDDNFHMILPIQSLERFIRKLAESALERIPDESAK